MRENTGQYREMIDDAVRRGSAAGSVDGPEWARGCDKCNYGIVAQPDLYRGVVPFFVARAMAMDMDGICYILYCDCEAGQKAQTHDEKTRHRLNDALKNTTVTEGLDASGHKCLSWGTDAPLDYIPGSWWAEVRALCEATHF